MSSYLTPFASSTNLRAHAIALPIFSALTNALIIAPFTWHFRNRNLGACALIVCLFTLNIFTFVNAIIWPNEDFASWWNGHGLCDIEAKLLWPLYTGIPCSIICITRSLASVLRVDQANLRRTTQRQRRRKLFIDCMICFFVPFLQLILHYVIQPNRYFIIAIGGCAPSFDESWPTIIIMYMWPEVFAITLCCYCVLIIIRMRKYRSQFAHILEASNSNLTTGRFLRLFIMSLTLLVIYFPVSTYLFYVSLNVPWFPYSWSFIHNPKTWDSIVYLPFLGSRTLDRWLPIAMTIFMFFFFGMGSDAIDIYRAWLAKLGLATTWPSLAEPRSRQGSTSSSTSSSTSGWTSKFSPVARAKKYFEARAVRKGSQVSNISNRGSTTLSLLGQKSTFSATTSDDRPLSGSTLTSTLNRPNMATITESHPSSFLPDLTNPFPDPEKAQTQSQSSKPFPGISGTAAPRYATSGGLFGTYQASSSSSSSSFPTISLPSMKFSPMNLLPSSLRSQSSRTTPAAEDTEMSQRQSRIVTTADIGAPKPRISKAEERARFNLVLTSQYREAVEFGTHPGWGPSPLFTGSNFSESPSVGGWEQEQGLEAGAGAGTDANIKNEENSITSPLRRNPTITPHHQQQQQQQHQDHYNQFDTPPLAQFSNTGSVETKIYATHSRGGSGNNGDVASGGGIQVTKKMIIKREGGVRILKRDSGTGRVYESEV